MQRSVDFWFALALTVLGGAVVVESWRMPRLENLGVHPMSAPGLTPAFIGLVLTGLGLAMLVREAATSSAGGSGSKVWRLDRLAFTAAICFVYAAGLVGRVPFWLATLIFVAVFAAFFTRSWPQPRAALTSLALAGATAVAVTYLFQVVFLVRLP